MVDLSRGERCHQRGAREEEGGTRGRGRGREEEGGAREEEGGGTGRGGTGEGGRVRGGMADERGANNTQAARKPHGTPTPDSAHNYHGRTSSSHGLAFLSSSTSNPRISKQLKPTLSSPSKLWYTCER